MPADSQLHSCLYEGVVHHRRMTPFVHVFRYRLFCVYLDLDELDRVFQRALAVVSIPTCDRPVSSRGPLRRSVAAARRFCSRPGRRTDRQTPGRTDPPSHASEILRLRHQSDQHVLLL